MEDDDEEGATDGLTQRKTRTKTVQNKKRYRRLAAVHSTLAHQVEGVRTTGNEHHQRVDFADLTLHTVISAAHITRTIV